MSWKSTVAITAQDARKKLMSKIMDANERELEELMDQMFNETPYNFQIVYDYDNLTNIDKFPEHLS